MGLMQLQRMYSPLSIFEAHGKLAMTKLQISRISADELPNRLITIPTMNRWTNGGGLGYASQAIESINRVLRSDDTADNTGIIVTDATNGNGSTNGQYKARDAFLESLSNEELDTIIFLTQESQKLLFEEISKRTNIPRKILETLTFSTGYASQRMKPDILVASAVKSTGNPYKVLTLDDDTHIPEYRVLAEHKRFQSQPNSQIVTKENLNICKGEKNSLEPFLQNLGISSDNYPGSEILLDSMDSALRDASICGRGQFIVSYNNKEQIKNRKIIGICGTKHGVPDYRTVNIAKLHLEQGFPSTEKEFFSYPSGTHDPFCFIEAPGNIDSACFSRYLDEETSMLPWWFVSSSDISLSNPLKTVTGHYRADNELLPKLLRRISNESNSPGYCYMSGISTQIFHNRARTGYRPDILEQATASLVGYVAAQTSLNRLKINTNPLKIYFEPVENTDLFVLENNLAEQVFNCLVDLKQTATDMLSQKTKENCGSDKKYIEFIEVLSRKTDNFNYTEFETALKKEISEQIQFFDGVLSHYPTLIEVTTDILENSDYPVMTVSR
jgi:hypothetical protein